MIIESTCPIQQLVDVQSTTTCTVFITSSAYGSRITTDRSREVCLVRVEHVISNIQRKFEIIQEVRFQISARTQVVFQNFPDIFFCHGQWVLFGSIRTVIFRTKVITDISFFVIHQLPICII